MPRGRVDGNTEGRRYANISRRRERPRLIGNKPTDVHERVQNTDTRHLLDAINEKDDADTADVILQSVFYGEVIFG